MILPFIQPQENELLNLSHVARFRQTTADCVEVHMSDGATRIYSGDAARIVIGELLFVLKTYRAFQTGIQQSTNSKPLIVPPDYSNGSGKIN